MTLLSAARTKTMKMTAPAKDQPTETGNTHQHQAAFYYHTQHCLQCVKGVNSCLKSDNCIADLDGRTDGCTDS